MKTRNREFVLAIASATALLAACGGGGGTTMPTPVTDISTTPVAVTVIDGVLSNALVCLDTNLSGTCDAGEPSARTDSAGAATLKVDAADAGKYPVLAVVGTDAVDADNGPVTTPFVLKAPADKPAVASPLTTLVQTQIEATGASTAEAEATVQGQIGLNVSLFQDFTKSTTTEGAMLNAIARTIVVTTQQQSQAVASAVGQQAIDGSTITQQALDALIARKILEMLPTVVSQLSRPEVQAAIAANDPAQLNAALAPVVTGIVASSGITSSSVGTQVGIANQAQSGSSDAAPMATASLSALTFNDAGNWFQRLFTATMAQNTPDANGNTRANERRSRKFTSGSQSAVAHWGFGGIPQYQSDLHWNGSNWVRCSFEGGATITGARDAQGRSAYDYCDGVEAGVQTRAVFDISGKSMLEVYDQVRAAGYTNLSIASAATALGSTVFPADSKLVYQSNMPLRTAIGYAPSIGSQQITFPASVAAGRSSPGDASAACAGVTGSVAQSISTPAATLENFVAANPGSPCVNDPAPITVPTTSGPAMVSSGPRNEWWSNSTANLGVIGNAAVGATQPASSPSYYTTNTLLRVAFGAGNEARYYACQQRATDGSTRNCDLIGTGTYAISTVGDARVLTLANTPAHAAALQERVFVERGGRVYLGYRNRTTPSSSARLNLPAANALLTRLGMETVDPEVPFALTPASYQGDWMVWNAAETSMMGTVLQIFPTYSGPTDSQSYRCLDPLGVQYACSFTLNATTGEFTLVDTAANDGTLTGTLSMLNGEATGVFTPTAGTPDTIVGRRR